jgi:hypothetical protein
MAGVGELQTAEPNIALYPVDNCDRNCDDDHQENADIGA